VSQADAFAPGTLRRRLRRTTAQARASGALIPIDTRAETIIDSGVPFTVRVIENLARKERAKTRPGDPFLPPEPELLVAGAAPRHLCVLNKFNVVEEHLLIVTREFEEQELLPDAGDFEALLRCMREFPSLGFYNGGKTAGASQRHKHLQLVPLPLYPDAGPPIPAEAALKSGALPFLHAWESCPAAWLEDPARYAAEAAGLLEGLLARTGIPARQEGGRAAQSAPYNMLMTRDWMLVVPRSAESAAGASINALGFAGSLLVRDAAALGSLRALGPMSALRNVALSPS